MVNKKINSKTEILKHLYLAKGETVSGVALSNVLNMSRVAVWKHIKTLQETGFDIQSQAKGYFLADHDDLLLPFCFNQAFQKKIFYFHELETTMDKAKFLAKDKAVHLSVVVAEKQTLGRGRLNRKWISSKGGLWFTLILKPETPPPLSYIYNFAASLSLSKSLQHLFDINVSVKWPNDLLLYGKKLAGLLSEMETKGDMVEFINIGIGLNVNNQLQRNEQNAVSLKRVLNKNISRRLILQTFLDDFKNQIQTLDPKKIIEQWKKHTSTIGSPVRIETLTEVYQGTAIDVDETGALIIQDKSGKRQKIIYGDCFHT